MEILKDLKTIYQIVKPKKNVSHAIFLEKFYRDQAQNYDQFRKKLLPGREELFDKIADLNLKGLWADFGAGTGSNLELMDLSAFKDVYLIDLSPSLLKQAKNRVLKMNANKIHILQEDVCTFNTEQRFDLITFSFSLTMIPNWFSAIDNAVRLLKPGGFLAAVDFHIPKNATASRVSAQHFWPAWFAWDRVFLSRDHLPYLQERLETLELAESFHRLPYMPLSQVPYYHFIGKKPV